MNSLEIGVLFFMENQKVTWEGKEPITKTGCPPERGCPREGWDEVGGPPSPLSSWDPWGITGTNKSL